MNKVKCPNCGASIYEKEPKCPFCGYINILGAEEKFMQDVQKTEDDLSQIPQLQRMHLKKTMTKSSRIIVVTIVIAVVFALCVLAFHLLLDAFAYGDYEDDPKAQMQWERQNFPILDEMYENGDYDKILAFETTLYKENDENKTSFSLQDWEHYDFIFVYRNYDEFISEIAALNQEEEISDYNAGSLVYEGLWFYYRIYDNYYYDYTEEEHKQIEEYREEIVSNLYDRLGFTEQELKTIEADVIKDGHLELDACWEYGREIKERIK